MTQDQIKEYILSLGFIDNTKNWNPHGGGEGIWFTWPGACNNAFLLSKNFLRIFSSIDLDREERLHFGDGRYINVSGSALLGRIKKFRDKIIRLKKEQRFKKIKEL